jgi:uncharacterized protein (DUF362 family)
MGSFSQIDRQPVDAVPGQPTPILAFPLRAVDGKEASYDRIRRNRATPVFNQGHLMQSKAESHRDPQRPISRRAFVRGTTLGTAAALTLPSRSFLRADAPVRPDQRPLHPVGEGKGIYPGRVVWVHDPHVLDWEGPGHGHWYQNGRLCQDRVDVMMRHAVCRLTGQDTVVGAWDRLFRHLNEVRGKAGTGYQPGEKVLIKPNWVGMIWLEGAVDAERYTLIKRQDYMNTAPQMIIALVRQLTAAGVKAAQITVCDTLAYLVHEYYEILHRECPEVQYADFAGKFGRTQVQPSTVPLFWSCRPQEVAQDFIPTCFVEAEYLVNFATLKAHAATGVTLCGKNHFGSLVRWPVERGYHDMHRHSFSQDLNRYREQVDLLGHAHLGGKTVLNLVDGLFCGKHPHDAVPRRMSLTPFTGDWTKSLFASQDPIAIDSVGYDLLHAEYDDFPRRPGVDDYLHEAALAPEPPSGTFYDPDHESPVQRLASLGVHEHWNNPVEKQYSRNLGRGEGIELVAHRMAS